MTYDAWKTTDPADDALDAPRVPIDCLRCGRITRVCVDDADPDAGYTCAACLTQQRADRAARQRLIAALTDQEVA